MNVSIGKRWEEFVEGVVQEGRWRLGERGGA